MPKDQNNTAQSARTIKNFHCSKHGSITPIPRCPKCLESDNTVQEIVEEIKQVEIDIDYHNCEAWHDYDESKPDGYAIGHLTEESVKKVTDALQKAYTAGMEAERNRIIELWNGHCKKWNKKGCGDWCDDFAKQLVLLTNKEK